MISDLLNAIIQVLAFTAIPFLWWLITARKKENFFHWIGLKRFERTKDFTKTLVLIILAFGVVSVGMLLMMRNVETATSNYSGEGIHALPSAIIFSFISTALSEEILFRGFLLKRIAARFGFAAGNTVQAVIFGLLHGVLFFSVVGAIKAIMLIASTGFIGGCMGYVNEKKSDGSILPSWFIHGIANLFSSIIAMFSIL